MRKVSDSPLTLDHFSTNKRSSVRALPRALGRTDGLLLTPFPFRQTVDPGSPGRLLDLPYPPRSRFCSRLGEGSVRRLSAFALSLVTLFGIVLWPCPVCGEALSVDSGALARAVKTHISEMTAWREGEIEIRSITTLTRVVLPPGDLTFHVSQTVPPANFHSLMLPIEASLEDKMVSSFWIKAEVAIRARVLRATRRLPFGHTVGPGDVAEGLVEIADPRAHYLRSRSEAVGNLLRRTVTPGDPLTRECITPPFLIRSGETVKIRMRHGSIALAALARAEQNGKLGQVIRVRNLEFSRPVKAEVTGPGEVTIE